MQRQRIRSKRLRCLRSLVAVTGSAVLLLVLFVPGFLLTKYPSAVEFHQAPVAADTTSTDAFNAPHKSTATASPASARPPAYRRLDGLFHEGPGVFSFDFAPGCDDPQPSLGLLRNHSNWLPDGDGRANFTIWCGPVLTGRSPHGRRVEPDMIEEARLVAGLPRRSPGDPYVAFVRGLHLDGCSRGSHLGCARWSKIFRTRDDILYAMMDRGGARLCDNHRGKLPGFSLAPDWPWRPAAPDPKEDFPRSRRLLLFFAGRNHEGFRGSSMARPWLFRSFEEWNRTSPAEDVLIVNGSLPPEEYFDALLASVFCLVPRGDERWNNRLVDVVRAGAIPVFMADGLEPPFAPLIRWELASVRVEEEAALDIGALLRRLRSIPVEEVAAMGRNVRRIEGECFETARRRADCTARSAWILVRDRAFPRPLAEFADRMRLPLCPTFRGRDDNSGIVWYENNSFSTWHTLY